jgi:6-pyruvoyltetrahydropterin/6-carboxytetrahydropterin synthase
MGRYVRLSREVRFSGGIDPSAGVGGNSFAGNPLSDEPVPQWTLTVELAGEIDMQTGMLVNIREVDELVRGAVVGSFRTVSPGTAPLLLRKAWMLVKNRPGRAKIDALTLAISPWLRCRISDEVQDMMEFTERFEFSAAHRLHSEHLTDAQNAVTFGKCNNPHGHGHNYELEITVIGPLGADGRIIPLQTFHDIVNRKVIDRMDHRHLNIELPEFARLNPTVENIAMVIFNSLSGQFPPSVKLQRVRVWETPKTSCTIEADGGIQKETP